MSKEAQPQDSEKPASSGPKNNTLDTSKGPAKPNERGGSRSDEKTSTAKEEAPERNNKGPVVNTDAQKHATNRDAIRSDSIANTGE